MQLLCHLALTGDRREGIALGSGFLNHMDLRLCVLSDKMIPS